MDGTLVVLRCGERRKWPVRLISTAGADKAFVHSPTTADRSLGACESGVHVSREREKDRMKEIEREAEQARVKARKT